MNNEFGYSENSIDRLGSSHCHTIIVVIAVNFTVLLQSFDLK